MTYDIKRLFLQEQSLKELLWSDLDFSHVEQKLSHTD